MKSSWFKNWLLALLFGLATLGAHRAAAQTYNLTDLGALVGTNSYAQGINSTGQVVGYWTTSTNVIRAFLYSGGAITDLGVKS